MLKVLTASFCVVIVALLVITDPSYAFRDNIIGAWLMDEGSGKVVRDVTGNHGESEIVVQGDWTDGKFGKALSFDGSGGHVQIAFDPKFAVINESDFTFGIWFMTETLPKDRGTWIAGFQQMDANGTGRTWMGIQNDTEAMYSALGNIRPLGAVPEVGQWTHFASVVEEDGDNDTIRIYSDGELMTEEPLSVETCEGDYLIGCHKNLQAINSWEGILDEVVLINKALTEEELSDLMTQGVQGILAVESRSKLATTWGEIRSHL